MVSQILTVIREATDERKSPPNILVEDNHYGLVSQAWVPLKTPIIQLTATPPNSRNSIPCSHSQLLKTCASTLSLCYKCPFSERTACNVLSNLG